jgi:hypothetical protein
MFLSRFKSSISILPFSPYLLADSGNGGSNSGNGGSELEIEEVREKIAASKSRRIPVGKFIFLLAVIVLTLIVLEHFI